MLYNLSKEERRRVRVIYKLFKQHRAGENVKFTLQALKEFNDTDIANIWKDAPGMETYMPIFTDATFLRIVMRAIDSEVLQECRKHYVAALIRNKLTKEDGLTIALHGTSEQIAALGLLPTQVLVNPRTAAVHPEFVRALHYLTFTPASQSLQSGDESA